MMFAFGLSEGVVFAGDGHKSTDTYELVADEAGTIFIGNDPQPYRMLSAAEHGTFHRPDGDAPLPDPMARCVSLTTDGNGYYEEQDDGSYARTENYEAVETGRSVKNGVVVPSGTDGAEAEVRFVRQWDFYRNGEVCLTN